MGSRDCVSAGRITFRWSYHVVHITESLVLDRSASRGSGFRCTPGREAGRAFLGPRNPPAASPRKKSQTDSLFNTTLMGVPVYHPDGYIYQFTTLMCASQAVLISKLICRRNRVLSRVLGLFDGTGAQIQDKKSDVGEKRCLWRILEKPGKRGNKNPSQQVVSKASW